MSDKPECELCGDSGTMFYPNGGPWGAGARGKCPHLDGGKTSEKYRIAAGLRKATTKDEVVSVMVGGHRMSDELTMRQKGIRGLIAALEVEAPTEPKAGNYKRHPEGMLLNSNGVPVMPIYRIVEVVLAAALEATVSEQRSELVAIFSVEGESHRLAAIIGHGDLPEPFESALDGWDEDDLEGVIATIVIERKAAGYCESLPESEGW